MGELSRRQFLGRGSAVLAGASLASSPAIARAASLSKSVAPSDGLNFGLIGAKGMGWSDLNALRRIDGVECIALCDVDREVLAGRSAELEQASGKKPTLYKDYRELLENDDIDFVVIATPDHWHCLQMVHACEAGKDVYVEKPLANTIQECYVMMAAAERYGRVVQVGQWQRSAPHWEDAIDFLKSGELGTIRVAKAWAYQGWMNPVPPKPDGPAPEHVDYDLWLGPAPKRPFNENRFHFNFRWFWDYAGGLMTDWGVHLIDYVFYGMGVSRPQSVMSMGGKYAYDETEDASETPDTQQAIYEFDGFSMIWEHATGINGGPYQRDHGVAFIGNNGTLVIDRGGWEIFPEAREGRYRMEALPRRSGSSGLNAHAENFIECIRSRGRTNCPADVAANTAINAHMGNIALRVGGRVYWDEGTRRFRDNDAANRFLTPTYRAPWSLPKV
jgi:predicted dehydrogenase